MFFSPTHRPGRFLAWSPVLLLLGSVLPAAAAPLRSDQPVVPAAGGAIDFERHVMGLFGRFGCASGSCHGSFQGKGGLRLSLFGYDPGKDYHALTRDLEGRRIDRADPDNSLLLLKATGRVPHEGGARFARSSWAYRILRTWIVQGASWTPGSGTVAALTITPAEFAFTGPGQTGRLRVQARFASGVEEDITALCDFRTNDEAVVEVAPDGGLRSRRPGDTAIIVSYRGQVRPVRAMVPNRLPAGFRYPQVPTVNYIDREVFAKLRRLNMVPSGLSSDAEFLRRVTIDTIGTLPTPDEVRTFLADRRPDKRDRKIDELLAHPMHAALWATKFCDVTGNQTDALENPQQLKPFLSQLWHDWFRKRLAANVPYDRIVHDVLCASSLEGKSPADYIAQVKKIEEAESGIGTPYAERATLDLFWRRQQRVPLEIWGEKTAAAFLGVRLECAQCHKHPFDRWTQEDYRAYANVFAKVTFGISPESARAFRDANASRNPRKAKGKKQQAQLREVYLAEPRQPGRRGKGGRQPAGLLRHPDTNEPLTPRALGGPEVPLQPGQDPREVLFAWMRSPDNPFFARSFVNRVWGHYFGTGIVHPVDDFSLANPPSNEKLLDALARDFLQNGYDIRKLERAVLRSRTYQLSSQVNDTNRFDRTNYAHSYVRPLMAEVVVDVLNEALGVSEPTFGPGVPKGCRAIEVGASRLQNNTVAYAFRIFGRPPRTTACDCERAMDPALPQKLFLMADPTVQTKLRAPKNRVRALLAEKKDDNEILEELFLATLSRRPTAKEKAHFTAYLAAGKDRPTACIDTLWALVNTTEFIFNH